MNSRPFTQFDRPTRIEQAGFVALLLITVAFGFLVEWRSAFLHQRKTDLNVYLYAAWAIRAGESPYEFITFGECHYNYPPLLAILLVPLANKPGSVAGPTTVPFGVSVALWYVFSVVTLAWAVHRLATALEKRSTDPAMWWQPRGCRRWWGLRIIPVLVCLPGLARTLALGQVDLLVLVLLCEMVTASLYDRKGRAGLWLGGAISIKLIPAFLLLYPLWRRDVRWLAGTLVGLTLGWVVIPTAVLGPEKAWEYHRRWAEVVILPGVGLGQDHTRETDLTSLATVNSQSLVGILHSIVYPRKELRPAHPGQVTTGLAVFLVGLLILGTVLAARRPRPVGPREVITLGALIAVLLLLVPICHPHYFCHWLPLVMGLLAWENDRKKGQGLGRALFLVFALNLIGNSLTSVPGLTVLREWGVATLAGLLLWAAAVRALWLSGRRKPLLSRKTPSTAEMEEASTPSWSADPVSALSALYHS
jgi:hypothetical protein